MIFPWNLEDSTLRFLASSIAFEKYNAILFLEPINEIIFFFLEVGWIFSSGVS